MSGELARRDPHDSASLVDWAQQARDAHGIAESLARTSFVPKAMQGHPEEVTAAILTGRELGLEPMAALRSINIIQGTPALTAAGMRGLAQSLGHQIWVEESSDTRAVVCGRRKGSPDTERVIWTIDKARKAKLAGKDTWEKFPAAMLVARATTEVVRRIAADALMGMPYSTEELTDNGAPPDVVALDAAAPAATPAERAPAKAKPRTLKRAAPAIAPILIAADPAPAADAASEAAEAAAHGFQRINPSAGGSPPEDPPPVAEPEPLPEPQPDPEPDLMTEPQRKALMAVYRKAGGDRDSRIAHASDILGRDVTSFNELTKRDAMVLLDALTAEDGEQ
jgi:hypothetical protein